MYFMDGDVFCFSRVRSNDNVTERYSSLHLIMLPEAFFKSRGLMAEHL